MNKVSIDYCGWDIGGAHLKFAGVSVDGELIVTRQIKCPLWLGIDNLVEAIRQIKSDYALDHAEHAITMTGELCDNFKNRTTGVHEIITGISKELDPHSCLLYGLDNQWYQISKDVPWRELASANWHASASFVGRKKTNAIVVDFGSTTVDIIPVRNGRVLSKGRDDFDRLKYRELVYTGMVRTPVSSIVRFLPFEHELIPVVAESFSNAADVYRILDVLPESSDLYPAMDGGGKTQMDSARRLLRMIGRDYDEQLAAAQTMAKYVSECQLTLIQDALLTVADRHTSNGKTGDDMSIVGLGCGAQLLEQLATNLDFAYLAFDELVQIKATTAVDCLPSVCAPATAVAAELRFLRTSSLMA